MEILLWIIVIICVIILFVVSLKITIYFEYLGKNIKLKLQILGYKIDILNIISKNKVKKVEAKVETDVKQEAKSSEKESKDKTSVEKKEIEDYLKILELGLEILDEITKSITFEEITLDVLYSAGDSAKTAKTLGSLWATYGNVTAFLYANFKIQKYNINIKPLWNVSQSTIDINTVITINTRIIRVLRHTKVKNIMEIKKRFE